MRKSFYHYLLVGVAVFGLAACGNKPAEPVAEAPAEKEVPVTEMPEGTGATAPPTTPEQAAYEEYAAFYEGILPCADCDGIKVTLLLNADRFRGYLWKEEKLGKSDAPIMERNGTWGVNNDVIGLSYGSDIVKYQGSEKGLLQLDKDGNPMDAKRYFLKKI